MNNNDRTPHKLLNTDLLKSFDSYVKKHHRIDCGLGSNPLGAPPAVQDFWKGYNSESPEKYYDSDLIAELSIRVGEYVDIAPERLYFSNGSISMLSNLFFKMFTQKPKLMLGIGPQFPYAIAEWLYSGGEYVSEPLDKDEDLNGATDRLIKRIRSVNPTVVFIDNPNNPTGLLFSLEQIEEIAIICQEAGAYLIVDEAYADYMPMKCSAIPLTDGFFNLIVVRTFSKGLGMASIRLGYCAVPESLAQFVQNIICPFTPSKISIDMACYVLPGIDGFLIQNRNYIREKKRELTQAFRQKGFSIWSSHEEVPIFMAYHQTIPIFRWLKELGVITVSGKDFAMTCSGLDDNFCRIRVPGCKADFMHLLYRLKNNSADYDRFGGTLGT